MTPSAAFASVLVDELVRGGVRDVVLCPGSRSAPLAYALLAAERDGRLRLHVRVDERSAGFLALGLARGGSGSPRPVAVVTTSGTAVANLHPAVLEAHHGGVPLVVLSADRPHELRGTGANQTTAQPGIFGRATRWSADLPAPEVLPTSGGPWRSVVCRALAAARGVTGGAAGPVHLDVAFRDPLVPELTDRGSPGGGLVIDDALAGRPDGAPWVVVVGPSEALAPGISFVERTLVVIGDLPSASVARAAADWALGRGHPVVAEPFGPSVVRASALPHGPLLLTASRWVSEHLPERVVVIGRPTLSRAVAAVLRAPGVLVEVVADGLWADPAHVASRVHPFAALEADAVPPEPDSVGDREGISAQSTSGWAEAWQAAGARVAEAVAAQGLPESGGLAVAAAVASALPEDAVLVVGSSNTVRDLDLGVAGAVAGHVVANRGLAGIDGLVSTAVGVALTSPSPAYALLGDLTFLHDSGGLLIGPGEPRPDLSIIVANDDGGGIFTTLEPGEPERSDTFERIFGTPTGTDLGALCLAHGVGHTRADSLDALSALVAQAPEGLRVIEISVDRGAHRSAHEELRALAQHVLQA
ncbi:MAG: 2-succinyl-5-enolpyruvyl-6-hydroxy-3-cyclohexene-1-carboxylic-acid synthase [Ornithinibacter sp.]